MESATGPSRGAKHPQAEAADKTVDFNPRTVDELTALVTQNPNGVWQQYCQLKDSAADANETHRMGANNLKLTLENMRLSATNTSLTTSKDELQRRNMQLTTEKNTLLSQRSKLKERLHRMKQDVDEWATDEVLKLMVDAGNCVQDWMGLGDKRLETAMRDVVTIIGRGVTTAESKLRRIMHDDDKSNAEDSMNFGIENMEYTQDAVVGTSGVAQPSKVPGIEENNHTQQDMVKPTGKPTALQRSCTTDIAENIQKSQAQKRARNSSERKSSATGLTTTRSIPIIILSDSEEDTPRHNDKRQKTLTTMTTRAPTSTLLVPRSQQNIKAESGQPRTRIQQDQPLWEEVVTAGNRLLRHVTTPDFGLNQLLTRVATDNTSSSATLSKECIDILQPSRDPGAVSGAIPSVDRSQTQPFRVELVGMPYAPDPQIYAVPTGPQGWQSNNAPKPSENGNKPGTHASLESQSITSLAEAQDRRPVVCLPVPEPRKRSAGAAYKRGNHASIESQSKTPRAESEERRPVVCLPVSGEPAMGNKGQSPRSASSALQQPLSNSSSLRSPSLQSTNQRFGHPAFGGYLSQHTAAGSDIKGARMRVEVPINRAFDPWAKTLNHNLYCHTGINDKDLALRATSFPCTHSSRSSFAVRYSGGSLNHIPQQQDHLQHILQEKLSRSSSQISSLQPHLELGLKAHIKNPFPIFPSEAIVPKKLDSQHQGHVNKKQNPPARALSKRERAWLSNMKRFWDETEWPDMEQWAEQVLSKYQRAFEHTNGQDIMKREADVADLEKEIKEGRIKNAKNYFGPIASEQTSEEQSSRSQGPKEVLFINSMLPSAELQQLMARDLPRLSIIQREWLIRMEMFRDVTEWPTLHEWAEEVCAILGGLSSYKAIKPLWDDVQAGRFTRKAAAKARYRYL